MLPDADIELARELLRRGAILVDVRTPGEYAAGYLEGAINIPHDTADSQASVEKLLHATGGRSDVPIVVYCVFGKRGAVAKQKLMRVGFQNVSNISGLDGLLGRRLIR